MAKIDALPNIAVLALGRILNLLNDINQCKTIEDARPHIVKAVGLVDFALEQAREAMAEHIHTRH